MRAVTAFLFIGFVTLVNASASFSSGKVGRVIGGAEVTANSIPYQVALEAELFNGDQFCSGSLISSTTVLTAAHCVYMLAGEVKITLGAHNLSAVEDEQIVLYSEDVVIHEDYSTYLGTNDIALVLLPEEVTLSSVINVVSLPTDDSETYAGQIGTVSGWGRTSDNDLYNSDVLHSVDVEIMSNAACGATWDVYDTQLCTSAEDEKTTCKGDDGDPLVVDGVQVGIVSFYSTISCTWGNYPIGYVRVSSFLDWINDNME